jgi:O-antigen ligase
MRLDKQRRFPALALAGGTRSYTGTVLRYGVRPAALPLVSVALVGVVAGMLVARMQHKPPMPLIGLLAVAGLVIVVTLAPRHVFFAWLTIAPLLEPAAADASAAGRALVWALYIAPAAGMLVLTMLRRQRNVGFTALDAVPIAFVAYVCGSIVLTTNLIHTDFRNTLKVVFLNVGLGVVLYCFLTLGPGAAIERETILKLLLWGGIFQGLLAMVNAAAGWTLWGNSLWQGPGGFSRASSTLANPAVLGAYLGAAVVIGVAVLAWGGPPRLQRLALVTVAIAGAGLMLTLTRGPILAGMLAATALVVFGRTRARLVGWGLIAVAALVIFALLPKIERSPLYRDRIAESQNVQFRVAIQNVSLRLAGEKPVLGWGYGSFDRVKERTGVVPANASGQSVLQITSHNTYLTMLVELGGVGLVLYVLPFVVFGIEGLQRARERGPDAWIAAGALAALCVAVFTGATLDYRFFSFALMLPWLFLAILRQPGTGGTTTSSHQP